ncbi:hypothetical protein SAY86_031910 [Trapa natans]|uniref:Uncharacterized protein n=1 Tax=Trapa natans TaxID=22666 RepID=A0AAN7M437_TRANT|nr:hypothetical protein SAY86_031910 [Trapa natans]
MVLFLFVVTISGVITQAATPCKKDLDCWHQCPVGIAELLCIIKTGECVCIHGQAPPTVESIKIHKALRMNKDGDK